MMMKFQERSALVIVFPVADIQAQFQLKIVDHFLFTTLLSAQFVLPATVARTKSESYNFTK